jgi:hypothetical protein
MAGTARLLSSPGLKGPYEACIARYGDQEHAEKVVVSIVDTERRLVIDHKMWLISEYCDDASRTVEGAMESLTDDMTDYCERNGVGKVFIVDNPFPLIELEQKCPHCGGNRVRVPWRYGSP